MKRIDSGMGEMKIRAVRLWGVAATATPDTRNYRSPYPTMTEIGKRAAISYYAPMIRKPLVRSIVRLLRKFG